MKKIVLLASSVLAAFVMVAANLGSGMASIWGWHQPKVPERLIEK